MDRMKWIGVSFAILMTLLCSGDDGRVDAQLAPGALRRTDSENAGGPTLFLSDRGLQQALSHARKMIAEEQFNDAVRQLQVVLDHPEDSFYHPDTQDRSEYRGIKAEAQRIVESLPKAGREAYESQFGPEAQRLLDEARQHGDAERLAETARRYFCTRAGVQAMDLLGAYHLDHGRYLAAALCFERLLAANAVPAAELPQERLKVAFCWLRADEPERATQQLARLRQETKGNRITIGGRDVKLFSESEAPLAWLERALGGAVNVASIEPQWMLFRGNAARSAAASGGTPFLKTQWQFSTTQWKVPSDKDPLSEEDVDVTEQLKTLDQQYQESGNPLLPGLHPLIVGKVVLFRTYNQLEAVDLTTGRELWRSVDGDPVLEQLRQTTPAKSPANGQPLPISVLLRQRAWEDATFGSLSSNGDAVFCIEDLGFWGQPFQNAMANHPLAAREYNRLTAYGVRTGKLLWEIGGPRGESELPLAGFYFLGPPLPIGRQLFVLAETSGEVQLISLNSQNGRMQWAQPLAQSELSVQFDLHRRRSGLSPTAADGVVVCPTGAGALVAVDATLRTLLWAYRYQESNAAAGMAMRGRGMMAARIAQQNTTNMADQDRWHDALPMVVDGRVIVTPRDSDEIHCLNLLDGSLQWKRPRGQGLYVAGVSDDRIIVVGRRQIEALSLKDGSAIWAPVQLPPPSGRAFLTDDLLHVPLSTAEVATIDLNRGRILARSRARDGRAPGNLICSQGMVISQRYDTISGFRQLDGLEDEINRSLAQNADDPTALALRGEIRLNQGKLHDAYTDLRKSLEGRADPETRALLFESLLEGLRTDFATYRRNLDEIEALANDSPTQRGAYLRVLAAGLQQTGDRNAAFEIYLRLAGDDVGSPPLERLEGGVAVRRDRWVRAQIADLYASASADERANMDQEIARRLKLASDSGNQESLRRFVSHFALHPAANLARKELATQLLKQGLELESEELLMVLLDSSDDKVAGWAAAQLAMALVETAHPEDAAFPCGELARRFQNVGCVDDKTGADLLEAWADNPEFAPVLKPKPGWPTGKVNVVRKDGTRNSLTRQMLPIEGPRGPYYGSGTVSMFNGTQGIASHDGEGHEVWKLTVNSVWYNPYTSNVRIHNHLVLATMGAHVMAIDVLGTASDRKPRLLWKEELVEAAPGGNRNAAVQMQHVRLAGGGLKVVALDQFGQPIGSVGAVNSDYLCLQRGRQLLALDPITGRTLWQRFDVTPGSEFFGDSQYIFLTSPQSEEALVLRASDGVELGNRPLPKAENRLLSTGRRTVSWTRVEDHQVLSLIDVWTRETIWKHEFAPESRASLVEHKAVAVVEPSGRFVLVQLDDGETQIDAPVELTGGLQQIDVIPSKEHYVLFTGNIAQMPMQNKAYAFGNNNPVITGRVHLFDRKTGLKLWSHPLDLFGFDLSQPADLPILIFGSKMPHAMAGPQGQPMHQWDYKLLCLDKRTGKPLIEMQDTGLANSVDITAERAQKRISLNIPGQKLVGFELTFTDEAESKPAAAGDEEPKPAPDLDEAEPEKPKPE
jgi:outer membrane protein assembly factor BamB